MTDIVERLRYAAHRQHYRTHELVTDAADEIDRLRAELGNEVDLSEMRLRRIQKDVEEMRAWRLRLRLDAAREDAARAPEEQT